MDEAGMSDADKVEFVADVLLIWGEEAAQELAERYAVDLNALKRDREASAAENARPHNSEPLRAAVVASAG